MSYYTPHAILPPPLMRSSTCALNAQRTQPLIERWITEMQPVPKVQFFPDELLLAIGYWCMEPRLLLNLSSTCRNFAKVLRSIECWLDHHWGRGYDIGILSKKVQRATASSEHKFGPDGWGVLVKSAFDKAEFPDDNHMTQWYMGKPTPHVFIEHERLLNIPDAVNKFQPRGERWMRVMFDILTEHECHNLELYPFLNDEALKIRVKAVKYRYLQALISASELMIRMWSLPIGAITSDDSIIYNQISIEELPVHDHRKGSLTSLTYTFLIANKFMQIDPGAQIQRKLYPHPPLGPSVWENENGDIDSNGVGWVRKVQETWKGRVYAMGQYTRKIKGKSICARLTLSPAPIRMCLDFLPNGEIRGRGGDFGGVFIVEGRYSKTFVELKKEYQDEDADMYLATGHMTPWGVFGRWTVPESPNEVMGYWCMWIYEGAPVFPLTVPYETKNGMVYPKPEPYKANPNWFVEYETARDAGKHIERLHGWFTDPPPEPEQIPLPEPDVWGL